MTNRSVNLGNELVTIISAKIKDTQYSDDAKFDALMDYALGYTRNRFQEYLQKIGNPSCHGNRVC